MLLRQLVNKSFKYFPRVRSITTVSVNGFDENIYQQIDYPLLKCQDILKNDKISILGYGPQGRGQALNLRDNNFDVCIGLRENGTSWKTAVEDGWIPGKSLLSIEDAAKTGSIVQYLLSDAGQIEQWDVIKPHMKNKMLYFSHGFGVVFNEKTNIIPDKSTDVVLVAPKGSGLSVRQHFTKGKGINSSVAIHQDYSGKAKDRTMALAFGIGSGHVFETTFENEVFSDLTGERCVLMGLIQGAFLAQYEVLRKNGHSPSESYNETVEEALESLYPLISEKGMDWLYSNCSTTAQRGALDWAPKFKKVIEPVIEDCYKSVRNGSEASIVIKNNKKTNYRDGLNKELQKVKNHELWRIAEQLRNLRK